MHNLGNQTLSVANSAQNVEISINHYQGLMATGVSLGVLHVLAGPDHLSSLAALSVGNSWKAFSLGFRWGLGHSSGLIVVAVVFILLKGNLDLKLLGRYCDTLVGAFMILLGLYGVLAALQSENQKENIKKREDIQPNALSKSSSSYTVSIQQNNHTLSNHLNSSTEVDESFSSSSLAFKPKKKQIDLFEHKIEPKDYEAVNLNEDDCLKSDMDRTYSSSKTHNKDDSKEGIFRILKCIDMRDPFIQKVVSFSIGLLHGVAGPGGILGVLPAVEMRSLKSSTVYLSSFIIASTLSMGMFASLYGEITKRLGATQSLVDLSLRIFSSTMSVLVGILWFVLSIRGDKEKFFH